MLDKELVSLVRNQAKELIAVSTVIATILLVLRLLNIVNWNLDLALILLSQMNLWAELLLTGALTAFLILSSSISTIFFSHELGDKIPWQVRTLGAIMSALVFWLPLSVSSIYFSTMIIRIILNLLSHKTKFGFEKVTRFLVRNTFGLGATAFTATWFLVLPNGLLSPGLVHTNSGENVKGLLVLGSSQTLILNRESERVTFISNAEISWVRTDSNSDKVWMKSIVSHLVDLAPHRD